MSRPLCSLPQLIVPSHSINISIVPFSCPNFHALSDIRTDRVFMKAVFNIVPKQKCQPRNPLYSVPAADIGPVNFVTRLAKQNFDSYT
jgi:hypothetical protein